MSLIDIPNRSALKTGLLPVNGDMCTLFFYTVIMSEKIQPVKIKESHCKLDSVRP